MGGRCERRGCYNDSSVGAMVVPNCPDEPLHLLRPDPPTGRGAPRPDEHRPACSIQASDLGGIGVGPVHINVTTLLEQFSHGFFIAVRRGCGERAKDYQAMVATFQEPGPPYPPQDRYHDDVSGRLKAREIRQGDRRDPAYEQEHEHVPGDELRRTSPHGSPPT